MTARAAKARVATICKPGSATTPAGNVAVSSARGAVTYANVTASNRGASKSKVDRATGRVTIPKATRALNYTMKIKVTAAGGPNYKAKSQVVTCKITVK